MDSRKILDGLATLAVVNSAYILLLAIFWQGQYAGIMLNLSMDATFIACLYPYILQKQMPFKNSLCGLFKLLPVVAIVICKSSIGIGAFCLGFIVYSLLTFYQTKTPKRALFFILGIPLAVFTIAIFNDPELFSTNMRYENWVRSMKFFKLHINQLFGSGIGNYWSIGPTIENNGKFIFMHSDWLQALFELGYVGLAIIFSLFVHILIKTFHNPWLFSCVLTYSASALFNMPTKFALTSLFGILLIKLSAEKGIFEHGNCI